MKLSRYHQRALLELFTKQNDQLQKNRLWINKEPKDSPRVAWKNHRLHVAQVNALRKILIRRGGL